MNQKKYPWLPYVELVLIYLILVLIDSFTEGTFGFIRLNGLPYLGLILLFSIFYGLLLSLLSSLVVAVFLFVFAPYVNNPGVPLEVPQLESLLQFGLIFLSSLAIAGRIDNFQQQLGVYRQRLKKIVRRNWSLERRYKALVSVQNELESRVLRQKDSLVLLVQQLRTLERSMILDAERILLETIQIYSSCSKACFWTHQQGTSSIELQTTLGYGTDDRPEHPKSLGKNPISWSLKNLDVYTVRNLLHIPGMEDYDDMVIILAIPISLGHGLSGVVTIEQMPFEKCNENTENLLQLIIRLAEPALRRIWDLETMYTLEERNQITDLPLFTVLVRNLPGFMRKSKEENVEFCLILLELSGDSSFQKLDQSLISIRDLLKISLPTASLMYHYKSKNQLAIYVPGIGEDGAALLSVQLLSAIAQNSLELELLIGYASFLPGDDENPNKLFTSAEKLMEIQRI